jgi:hypothetical protein
LGLYREAPRVAERLLLHNDVEFVTTLESDAVELEHMGAPYRSLSSFLTEGHMQRVCDEARERGHAVAESIGRESCRSRYPGISDDVWHDVHARVIQSLEQRLARHMVLVEGLRACAAACDLRAVLVSTDYFNDTKALVLAAKRLGVPSIHLLHGFPYGCRNLHDEPLADVVAAYSEHAKSIYVDYGMDPDRIVVTGNPEWDVYAGPLDVLPKPALCTKLGLSPDKPIILAALTAPHGHSAVSVREQGYAMDTARCILESIAQLQQAHPDWQVLLRPHPFRFRDDAPKLQAMADELGLKDAHIDKELPQYGIAVADCVICTNSNHGIQAVLAGVPVLNVALSAHGKGTLNEGLGPLFDEQDAVDTVREIDAIGPAIEGALGDKVYEDFNAKRAATVRRFNYANDGNGLARFCTLVEDVVADPHAYVSPIARYPESEPALAAALAECGDNVLFAGRSAEAIRSVVISEQGEVVASVSDATGDNYDAVVLTDPLTAHDNPEALLRAAHARTGPGGCVLAAFVNGIGADVAEALAIARWTPARNDAEASAPMNGFSRNGVEILLSRSMLTADAIKPYGFRGTKGWVVTCRTRKPVQSNLARRDAEAAERCRELNAQGELAFGSGDLVAAANAFHEAIKAWRGDPTAFNNLATVLHLLERPAEAWDLLLDALHVDPSHAMARENLLVVGKTLGREKEADDLLGLFGANAAR